MVPQEKRYIEIYIESNKLKIRRGKIESIGKKQKKQRKGKKNPILHES